MRGPFYRYRGLLGVCPPYRKFCVCYIAAVHLAKIQLFKELNKSYSKRLHKVTIITLNLDISYGYRGRDARNNLYVLESGELVYYVAAVAVLYDRQRHKQRHYTGHNEDITW